VLRHLFEPFFTTKTDIGTGVGLWMARELAIRCGGRLILGDYAAPFATAFHLELPLAELPLAQDNGTYS
jgi:signal transduction histidine kinase